ncbi:DNA-formamidopyrimidine glycosylase family protein [Mobilicoccus sp.]|uniref:Fpg/Nei family DNA glycosylase n=1 Tax=Mobilicoccus sp. TaxID=2034349 RepID=UPI00289A3700|nr:zinc finger domain-containing protein [Mobilicoccus sp.]
MPEGHTIHAQARRLDRAFQGRPVRVSSPQGRFAESAALLDGGVFEGAEAAGKHLFLHHEGDRIVHVHLGLIGAFSVLPHGCGDGDVPVTGAVRLRLRDDAHVADLRGPNVCALITDETRESVLARLGPDPLREDADPDRAWAKISRSGRSIAELLMDQSVVAGVGNVYRCEVLFRHRVDPFRPGREIRRATWTAVWDDIATLLPLGVAYGQILTMTDQVEDAQAWLARAPEEVGAYTATLTGAAHGTHFERRFSVYKRTGEPCRVCGSTIRTEKVAGRQLYWCGRCQRRR